VERFASVQQEYASFLIRMWRYVEPAALEAAEWHGEIEHIQSGRHSRFTALTEMLDDLHTYLLEGESSMEETR
jgi:hypothetical protein